jgi:hypothetical protein
MVGTLPILMKGPIHLMKVNIGQKRRDDSSHTIDNFEFEQTVRYTRVWNKK